MAKQILLRNGTILQHADTDELVVLRETDLLIEDGIIKHIGKNVQSNANTRVLDCSNKILSPGFVDTHHHVWQTQLKGRHSDDTLLDYHPKGNLQFFNYTPEDVFWGELGGLLEAIDGGTTTIVDHAHMSRSPDHVFAGISATRATSIRSVFCYSLVPNIQTWNDSNFDLHSTPVPDWFLPTFEKLADAVISTSGRISLGFGFDGFHFPRDKVNDLFKAARDFNTRVITSHWRRNNMAADDDFSIPKLLAEYNLLDSDILLSHGTGSTDDEFKLLKEAGAYISTTPATESQMAHGDLVCFRENVLASLGADCHSNNPGSMLHNMHIGLAVVRAQRNASIISKGKFPRLVEPTTRHAFNLATICGARAVGMEDQIGSLVEGKQADIIIFDTSSPAMACAAEHNPCAAVVRHASPSDIDTVIIGGDVVKENGRLVDVSAREFVPWNGSERVVAASVDQKLPWATILRELQRSQREIQERIHGCSTQLAREAVMRVWGMPDAEKILA